MKKYIYNLTGEELSFGDIIPFEITPYDLNHLKNRGIIKEVKERPTPIIHTDISWHVEKLKRRLGFEDKPHEFKEFVCHLNKISVPYLLLAVLKEIALELDQKYPGHISECKEVYIIGTSDGEIHKLSSDNIKSFRFFAAFRTEEDAKFAKDLLSITLKEMFNNEQENKKYIS